MVRMGIWAPRSAMKSNPPVPTSGSRLRGAERPDLGLDGVHPLGGEHPAQQTSVQVVGRWILEEDDARAGSRRRP